MKLFFISDIHGSSTQLEKALELFHEEKADYLVILGDILNHGPRNPLPEGYNPQQVVSLLNPYKKQIIAVRGNCDSDVDQMLLEFPMMSDYSMILYEGKRLFLSHGHIYHPDHLPNISEGDALIFGHTHIPTAELNDSIYFINPGSITLPKGNFNHSYGILNQNIFEIKDFKKNIIKSIVL